MKIADSTRMLSARSSSALWRVGPLLVLGLRLSLPAQVYVPPATYRADLNLDGGWRFIRQDVTGAEATSFDDSTWTLLNLPHTWNNLDGQDGGNNYYRGIGLYRTHYMVDPSYAGRRFFLKFDGAFYVTDVWLNGNYLGEHQGGFAAFVFDATAFVNIGGDNVIAVKVNNGANTNIPPLSADFTFGGGLYRDVHLLVTDPVSISPLDYGSPGVYWQATNVSAASAGLQVTTVVPNSDSVERLAVVRVVLADAATNLVTTLTNIFTIPAGTVSNVVASTAVASPHLWDGRNDPYLYQLYVELGDGTNVTDLVSQPLGFRFFSIDPTNGFFLNGRYYDLHGTSMHQDWLNCGWALTNAQRATNFLFIKEIGATAVRLSHYEHDDYTYQLADENGIILWSEIPLINGITAASAFDTNEQQQLLELIHQRRNHPSVVCWGMYNEETGSATNLVSLLAQTAAQEDPTRPSTAASNRGNSAALNWLPTVVAFNKYYGWYGGTTADFAPWADNIHSNYPTRNIGVSEYGAGASVWQHSEDPVAEPANAGPNHPEEYQNLFHEAHWLAMKQRPFLWCKFVWNLFDFASDGRNEGDTPGRNDKGLVTYDRQIRKDAFYWYKANWTTNPMVYITGHTFTNRLTNSITAKVYANCDSVELFLNGISQGSRTNTNSIFTWPLTLPAGSNSVLAIGTKGAIQVSDSLTWLAPLRAVILRPASSIVFLNSTNDALQLAAAVSNAPGAFTTAWSQASGPGLATFADANALSTTASFNAEGVYGLAFTANNGVTTRVGLTVVVNPNLGITNGLLAWWKMDETGGAAASDSSGNNLNAAVSGAVFATGYLSNALYFNGSNSAATFSSPDAVQLTIAAWARADGQGNSAYPRILDTPGYRLFFRFDGQGSNGLDFATYSTGNGDWFSGANTIQTGAWYHVAASYDRSSFANLPALFVNGIRRSLITVTSPSGTQPPYTGTGYVGNKSGLTRAWKGGIDDLRIYGRLLSDAEVQALASMPPANLAPNVDAGSNQAVVWPGRVNLYGTATDDGQPNPPGALTLTWSEVSGPGTAAFANANVQAATAAFSTGGTYVLRLTADDGQVQTSSDTTVTVIQRPTIAFQPFAGAI
ncbi:MAG TPA: glycoside hydrolase family 2 TIM barrel-domain containing protein [Candidatus Acidoferrum sp.]|jgi:beta-galactosidase|nr:glycoside hydrolase family 2 TIM barrel-domain containing protein [Candidatus Acidoferrum sp.]